jgi:predicted DNA-binding WGR domain protein
MAKRYFEYKDAKSKKFWEVSVSGKKVNIRYGKIGTDGQTSLKELSTPAEAKAHAEKQAAGKVKKGYKEAKVKAVKKKTTKKKVAKKVVKKKAAKGKVDQVDQKARKAILKEVKKDGSALEHADKVFKADREVVLAAVKQDYEALQYAAKSLKADREFMLKAIKLGGFIEHAAKSLKADREIVLAAVKNYGGALEHADKTLKADREIVLAAVKEDGYALEYAAKSLKADRKVVLAAVKQSGYALQYADKIFKADRELVLKLVKEDGRALEYADKSLKADREIVLTAIKQDGYALQYVDKSLKKDKEIVLAAIKQDRNAVEYVDISVKKDVIPFVCELTVCGSQLIVDFSEYSLRDVNSKKKLREVLLEYLPTYNDGDRNSGLLFPPDSVEDSEGNSVELAIKSSGDLIPRPKKGKVLFVSYYSYDHEVYKVPLNSDEPVNAIGEKFDGERYITGYEQGGQEFCGHEKSVGEHNGHVSWCLLAHNKTHPFMNDLRGIDCESETDMDEIVDEVFAFLEKYLSSNEDKALTKKQIKDYKKAEDKADSSKVVLCLKTEFVERKFEEEEWTDAVVSEMALETIDEFVNDIKNKIGGNVDDRILICDPEEYYIDDLKKGIKKIKNFDDAEVYILITKAMPAVDLDSLLLDMDDYQFYANFPNDEGEIITQGYARGEYNTGYFAAVADSDPDWDPDSYINIESLDDERSSWRGYKTVDTYNKAKDILISGIKINNQEWVNKFCKKAEQRAKDSFDFTYIAEEVYKNIGDKEWAKNLYKKAEGKAEDYFGNAVTKGTLISTASTVKSFRKLAESVCENLGDKEWAKKVYKKAEGKAEDYSDFSDLAYSIQENLGDKEWAKNLYKKAEGKAKDSDDFYSLADRIHESLGDKEWVKKIYKKWEEMAEDFSNFYNIADHILENLGDKELVKKVYKKAEDKAENCDDYESLAESVRDNLGDKKWAKLLEQKAKELEEENDDEDDD